MHYYLHHISVQPSGLVFLSGGHHLLSFILHMRAGSIYVLSRSPTPTIPNLIIQVLFTLSKDRLTRIKFGILYYNLKFYYLEPRITIIHWIGMWLYDIIYLSIKKRGGGETQNTKSAKTIKTRYLRRVYRMQHKIGNRWIEYQHHLNYWIRLPIWK